MPIYGYACQHCGHTLDALQKMADGPLVYCPECDQPQLKRQLSAPRFRLKGQGWYETDFKKDNQRNLAGEKEAAKPDSDSDKKSDSKSDNKADGKSDNKADGKSDNKADGKSDNKTDGKSDNKTDKKPATKSSTSSASKSSGDKASAA